MFARTLRNAPTKAERRLWQALRKRQIAGARFRRQHPLGPYIADFVCLDLRLVIEADGGQHAENSRDRERDAWMQKQGYTVMRVWNNDVLDNLEGVVAAIEAAVLRRRASLSEVGQGRHLQPHPHPDPPPSRGREARTAPPAPSSPLEGGRSGGGWG